MSQHVVLTRPGQEGHVNIDCFNILAKIENATVGKKSFINESAGVPGEKIASWTE